MTANETVRQTFLATNHAELEWRDDDDVLALGNGVKVKIFRRDEETDMTYALVKLPAGYVEPEHVHSGEHNVVVVQGYMNVAGKTLGPGDFVFGPSEVRHGPYEHPVECILFACLRGSNLHRYKGSPAGEI